MVLCSFSERFRPTTWEQFLGQEPLLAEGSMIRRSLARGRPTSLLFWGPPGCGKTSLARMYIRSFGNRCVESHPSQFQTAEVKKYIEEAYASPLFGSTMIWIDEIHRLTRPQQDLFLKALEDGVIVVVAATTENPSFVLSHAFLSRVNVLTCTPLSESHLRQLFDRVLQSYPQVLFDPDAQQDVLHMASGDARKLLALLEQVLEQQDYAQVTVDRVRQLACYATPKLSAHGEGRYLLISALHKAVRGSDPQAALYWLARLFVAGEDPMYLARRLIRMSIEDIGLADPQAMQVALHGREVFQAMGSPEGDLALAEVVVYLALSPKSASTYVAFDAAKRAASVTTHVSPPKHILNAPTSWMRGQGFGEGYLWDHTEPEAFSGQEYFPDEVRDREYFHPQLRGFERELAKRMAYFARLKKELSSKAEDRSNCS